MHAGTTKSVSVILVLVMVVACGGGDELNTDPDAPGTTWISDEELALRMHECIEAAGFRGQLDGSETVFEVSPERKDVFDQVSADCYGSFAEAGLVPAETLQPTEDQLRLRYQFLLEARTCIENHGLTLDEPPTVESYVDANGENWLPHLEVLEQLEGVDESRIDEFFEACPQL
jgi:hypothetical protein